MNQEYCDNAGAFHGHDGQHHANGHTHGHSHTQNEKTSADGSSYERDKALLCYMLEHNRNHACELAEISERMHDAEQSGAADIIRDAVRYFEHGNNKLEEAIKTFQDKGN